MKKQILLLPLLALLILSGFKAGAQGSITYRYLENDPFDYSNFSASIDPLFVDITGHNGGKGKMGYAFGWGIRAEYNMGKRLLLNYDSRFSFGTKSFKPSNNNTRNYFNMEGGIGFILSNKTRSKNVPIILSQSETSTTRTTVYISGGVPAKVRSMIAFRVGMQQYTNTFDYDTKKALFDSLLTFSSGGQSFTYKEARDVSKANVFVDTVNKVNGKSVAIDQVGGIAITSLYAGFNFRSIHNLLIYVDGWGVRGNVIHNDFFIDMLFAPVIAIKDFKNSDGKVYNVKYSNMTPFGWRLGQFFRHPRDQGVSFKWEVGSRPGFKADPKQSVPVNVKNMYFMFTFGLYVPLRIKPIYTGD